MAKKVIIKLFLIFFFNVHYNGASKLQNDPRSYYTAGVAEFAPKFFDENNATAALTDNLMGYIDLIQSTEATLTDIIIFPESTLNNKYTMTFVPDPNEKFLLCNNVNNDNYEKFLIELSCVANSVSKYIVVNIFEKSICQQNTDDTRPCRDNGLNQYNTNVVFDRNGAIISRYRKVHLYGEEMNTTAQPEIAWFDTDFGVRFGHFVCFDIMFYTPAQQLIEKYHIQNIIFTSMWFSQLPFLTAVQMHSSWSYGNDVNLLASGASAPTVGNTGTGIYIGRDGPAVMFMNQEKDGKRNLSVAHVPKHRITNNIRKPVISKIPNVSKSTKYNAEERSSKSNYLLLKRDIVELYKSELINLTVANSLKKELCYNETFCCNFELNWKLLNVSNNSNNYLYRIGVLDGYRKETAPETNILKNCALFSCISEDIYDCGVVFPSNGKQLQAQIAFTRILIEAKFPISTEYLLMPNTLKTNLLPLEYNRFQWNVTIDECSETVRFLSNTTIDDLLTFSIYGNYYDGEDLCEKGAGFAHNSVNTLVWMPLVTIVLLFSQKLNILF